MKNDNSKKIILDLCGGTGAWSKPYKDAGYDVRVITLPEYDVTSHEFRRDDLLFLRTSGFVDSIKVKNIYGILAAPPCTMFSFARTNAKKPRDLKEGMKCVRACLNIIWSCMEVKQETAKKTIPLQFWSLENPYHGFLKKFLGKPLFTFDPWEFGDPYQKRTALWGHFNEPIPSKKYFIKKENKDHAHTKFDYMASKDIHPESFGKFDRQTRRSITPAGFAKAFYEVNQ